MLSIFLTLAAAATTAPADAGVEPAKEEKKICRNFPPPVGTRLGGSRVCKTAREWEDERQRSIQAVQKYQNQRQGPPNG